MAIQDSLPITPRRTRAAGKKTLGIGCAALLLASMSGIAAYLLWANTLPPPEPETAVLPSPNGYDACIAAATKLVPPAPASPTVNLDKTMPAALRAALRPEEPALEELRGAIRLEYVTPPIRNPMTLLPYLAEYRDGARKFVAESRLARLEGKPGLALDRALDAVELGSRVGRGGVLISHLVGLACSAIGRSEAERCVRGLSPEEARREGRRLDRIIAQFPIFADAMREERKASLAGLRLLFSGSVPVSSLTGGAAPAQSTIPLGRLVLGLYPKGWSYRTLDGYYRAVIREAEKPAAQRTAVPIPNEPFTRRMAPVFDQAAFKTTQDQAELLLLRLELALEEYRSRHGRYPASLAALSPEILLKPIPDPFSGTAMRYRNRGDDYLLYSIGPDGKDGGGVPIPRRRMNSLAAGDLVAGKPAVR